MDEAARLPRYERMPTYSDLVATILTETLACQDPGTPQSKTRDQSRYGPFGPHIPGDSGIYPTTDAAMEALADLADRYRGNDPALSRSVSRDALWMLASRVVGELLNELAREHDATKHWLPMVRDRMRARVQDIIQDIVHYVPVWLFLGQECAPFDIGPVRFIERKDWLADRGAPRPGVVLDAWRKGDLVGTKAARSLLLGGAEGRCARSLENANESVGMGWSLQSSTRLLAAACGTECADDRQDCASRPVDRLRGRKRV